MHKKAISVGLAGMLLAGVLIVGSFLSPQLQSNAQPSVASAETISDKATIEVSGVGKITVKPDIAYVNIGVNTDAKDAKSAQQSNADIFAKVKKAVIDFGVKEEDIKTVQYNVSPKYNWTQDKGQVLEGYTVFNSIEVKTSKLNDLGTLLDNIGKAGANQVNGIRFSTEKMEDYELQAITKAMDNAKAKANTIAKAAGKSVKGVLKVTHQSNNGGYTPPYVAYDSAKLENAASTNISQGQLTVETTVQVIYEF